MSDWEWTHLGWHHADIAASWLLGALAYVAILLIVCYVVHKLLDSLVEWIAHQLRVHRIRRQTKRSGRT